MQGEKSSERRELAEKASREVGEPETVDQRGRLVGRQRRVLSRREGAGGAGAEVRVQAAREVFRGRIRGGRRCVCVCVTVCSEKCCLTADG